MKAYGHIPLSRKQFAGDDLLWNDGTAFDSRSAWTWLIQSAAWKDGEYHTAFRMDHLKRGEFVASLRFLAERWLWSKNTVARFLALLTTADRITVQRKGQHGAVYLIVNYDTYNPAGAMSGTPPKSKPSKNGTGNGTQRGTPSSGVSDCNNRGSTDGDTESGTQNGTVYGTLEGQTRDKVEEGKEGKEEKPMSHGGSCDEYPPEFELLWKAYPKRSGTQNKRAAYRQYVARLAEGVLYDEMQAGTLRYNAWAVASGVVGQRVVLMAATFYGRDRHFLEPYDIPTSSPTETPWVSRAKMLYPLYLQHGFSRVQSEDTYKQQVKALAVEGTITEPRRFWAELHVVRPWTWLGTVRTQDQSRAIARIADLIATVPPVLESHQGGAAA